MPALGRHAFEELRALFQEVSGIVLGDDKRAMVESRLQKRIEKLGLKSFDDYCDLLRSAVNNEEQQLVIDLLTTNETYFFREPEQFEYLAGLLAGPLKGTSLRIWSAASSSGEEPYSLAMLLHDRRPEGGFQLRASDLSRRVLERARRGVFPLQRLEHMPKDYLKRFCLKGRGEYEGTFRVIEQVRSSVDFFEHNLLYDSPALGSFQVIFARNVLIYFDAVRKRQILQSLVAKLEQKGLLFVGQAESVQGMERTLHRVGRSIYEKL